MEVIQTAFLVFVVMATNAAANVIPDAQLAAPAREEGAAENDPNKNNVLGCEKPAGFEEMTNFDVCVLFEYG